MALFDTPPDIKKNKFSLEEAGKVFAKAAEDIESGAVPAEVTQTIIELARFLVEVAKLFKA